MTKFEEYLTRPAIKATFIIGDDGLIIKTDHTTYVQIQKDIPVSEKEILGKITQIKRTAKIRQIKVRGEKKARAVLKENYDGYLKNCIWCNERIDDMMEYATEVSKRGLHEGTCDDRDLNNICCNADMVDQARQNILSPRRKIESLISNTDYILSLLDRDAKHPYEVFLFS